MASEPNPDVRVKYFPGNPDVTQQIQEWAKQSGARILSIVPVYWEDATNG